MHYRRVDFICDELRVVFYIYAQQARRRLRTVVTGGITPPVPAAKWVDNFGRDSLRVDYDDVVQFTDFVVSRVSSVFVSQIPSTAPVVFSLKICSVLVVLYFKLMILLVA